MIMKKIANFLSLLFMSILMIQCQPQKSNVEHSWPHVKPENKPGTYWWWMGSAVDKKNLTYNLESLKDVGIGNVHVIPIYGVEGEEDKYIDFLSEDWMNMLSHTVDEAIRLNMNVDMSTTTGWPFGGSHVTQEDAAAQMVYKKNNISNGEKISEIFELEKVESIMAFSKNKSPINLADKLDATGKINWIVPEGDWEIYVVWQEGTGQNVKRAAPGNIGLVLDPFSPRALKKYLLRYDKAFENYEGQNIRAQYHDSYEYYRANWTNDFFKEFEVRNGYALQNYLPSILDTNRNNPHIKADYRRTLAELHLEYIENWSKWSHEKGWITRNEAHGAPANLLDLYAASDIPETETFGSRQFKIPGIRYVRGNNSTSMPPNPLILKFSSSAAHVTGKPLIASETGTWLRDHFKASLSQVKPEIDELFFCGINHIFYHGNAYSPKEVDWPGWLFYASTHFEKENAFWNDFSELNSYVTRCQSILQSGKPANDILLYWPVEDLYHSYPDLLIRKFNVHTIDWFLDSEFGKVAANLEKKGHSFDYISDKQILNVEYKESNLFTGGNNYKAILIPKTKHIPINTWEKLKKLANDGATIIIDGSLPTDVPGFNHLEVRRAELKKSLSELEFHSIKINELQKAEVGNGYFLLCSDVNTALNHASIKEEKIVADGINYIRREHENGYFYFFTNLSDKKLDSWIPLSVELQSALIYDPRYEKGIGVAETTQNGDNSEIYLQLQPGESCFVKTFTSELIDGVNWNYIESINDSIEINGNWKVEFIDGGPQLPDSFTTNQLLSWTVLGDSNAQSFAGTGKYTITFNIPNDSADDWLLNLGKVNESARVKLNGESVGTLWSFPFNMLVGKYIKRGNNILEIEVTNLSANRLSDLDRQGKNWEKFFFVNIFYKEFDATQWPTMDSGLLGPVTLTPQQYLTF
jgi:alpha-L-rhamnosidase